MDIFCVQLSCVAELEELDKMIQESMGQVYSESEGKMAWKCNVCGKTSVYKSHMRNHVETHVQGVNHQCVYCNKKLKTRESLRMHISTIHTGANYR